MERLEDAFVQFADRTAILCQGSPISYADLGRLIDLRTRLVETSGTGPLAYQLDNGLDWVAISLALLRTGRIGIPVPLFFSEQQRRHVLEDSGAEAFIGSDAPGESWLCTGQALWQNTDIRARPLPDHTALITYTSGTTGAPKGVCLSANTLLETASSIVSVLSPLNITRHMSVLPLSLLLEQVAGLLANLLNGGTTVLEPLSDIGVTGSSGLDLGIFLEAQNRWHPQSLILVPQLLLALTTAAELGMALPDTYRFIAVGGARVAPDLLTRARKVGLPVFEGYGLTECGSVVSLNVPGADLPGSVGRPLPHAKISCHNGEVLIGGSVHLGYAGCSTPPAQPLPTGDLGCLDAEGFLHVRGRSKHHYISAYGRNISPDWIESELTAELEISQAVVFGEGQPINIALLVPRMDAAPENIGAAVSRCNDRLPDYARIAAWQYVDPVVFNEAGCLTDNGRVRRDRVTQSFSAALEHLFTNTQETA